MKPVILFRESFDVDAQEVKEELAIAKKHFSVFGCRNSIPEDSLVIGRYSVLPYYQELEMDLECKGSRLINSYEQHDYLADITQYYEDIKGYTPKTFTQWAHINGGKWIVKGKTNSRKFRWNTHMFADGREALLKVIRTLMDDEFISEQGLIVREYEPLKKVDEGLYGLPISKEWRCFFYKDTLLVSGFYWSSHAENFCEDLPPDGKEFAEKVAAIISKKVDFFVMDVAEREDGGYIVIELNDGQMSGLSMCDPNTLYGNLARVVK